MGNEGACSRRTLYLAGASQAFRSAAARIGFYVRPAHHAERGRVKHRDGVAGRRRRSVFTFPLASLRRRNRAA